MILFPCLFLQPPPNPCTKSSSTRVREAPNGRLGLKSRSIPLHTHLKLDLLPNIVDLIGFRDTRLGIALCFRIVFLNDALKDFFFCFCSISLMH